MAQAISFAYGNCRLHWDKSGAVGLSPAESSSVIVEKRIGDWHNGAGYGLSLPDYLGLTDTEYAAYVERGELPKEWTDG